MPAEILVPATLILGLASIVILPFGIRAAKSTSSRAAIGLLYLCILTIGYFMGRAGMIADEQGIGGNEVPPFYGTEWYFMLVLVTAATMLQALLIRKHRSKEA